jgi:hypothetical protein
VICFDRIVSVLLGDVAGAWQQLLEDARVGRRAVGGHFSRQKAVLQPLVIVYLTSSTQLRAHPSECPR